MKASKGMKPQSYTGTRTSDPGTEPITSMESCTIGTLWICNEPCVDLLDAPLSAQHKRLNLGSTLLK